MARKNILLVNPHIEDFSAFDHFSKPLGLLQLAGYLRAYFNLHFVNALNRVEPTLPQLKFKPNGTGKFYTKIITKPAILDSTPGIPRKFKRYGLPDDIFMSELKNMPFVPDYIFVTSVMTYWYTGVQHTIGLLRKVFPTVPIVLGGIYASLLPKHAQQYSGADIIVPHQNINSVLQYIADITDTAIDTSTPLPPYTPPAYDMLGEYYYAPILTSVGCIFRCAYCASSFLNTFQQFPADTVADTIIQLSRKYGVKNFAFYDDALLYNSAKHLDIILRRIIHSGVEAKFYTPNGLHIRYLTDTTAQLMKTAGFVDIRLSLESNNATFQQEQGDKTTNAEFERAIAILKKTGFAPQQIQVYTLLNVPQQDSQNIELTMKYIHSLGATPRLAFYSPIPNTPDYDLAQKITNVVEPLLQNNTVYLYKSGFGVEKYQKLKGIERRYRQSECLQSHP